MNLGERLAALDARLRPAGRWLGWLLPPLALLAWGMAVARTGRWPSGDGPHLLGTAMRLAQLLRDLQGSTFAWCLDSLVGPHPPGAYVPALLSYTVLGTHWRWGHLVAGGLVLWLCWDGVRRLGGGWVGGIFLGASAAVWVQAESYGVDLVAAACVVQAASFLAASDRLGNRRAALAWGAWMGAGFLAKYTAPLFLWGPCLLAGYWVVRHRRWRELAVAVGAFLLVAGGWYLLHLHGVLGYVRASGDSANALLTNRGLVQGPWWSPGNLSWYPAVLLDAWGWPGALALLVGLLAWPRRRTPPASAPSWQPAAAWLVPLLAVVGGLLVLDLQVQRQDRYLLPAFPLLAALVGSSRGRWLLAPVGAMTAYGTAAVFATWVQVPSNRAYDHEWALAGRGWPWPQASFQPASLDPEKWHVDEMLTELRAVHGSDEGTVGLLVDETGGAPGFGLMLSRTTALGYRWHLATVMLVDGRAPVDNLGGSGLPGSDLPGSDLPGSDLPGSPPVFVGPFTDGEWPPRTFDALLVILKRGGSRREQWLTETGFQQKGAWQLPNGNEGRVYGR